MTKQNNRRILTVCLEDDVADFIEAQAKADHRNKSSYVNEVFRGLMDDINLDENEEDEMNALAKRILDRLFKENK